MPHSVADPAWSENVGPFGFENSTLPWPITTEFADPTTNSEFIVSYYFEKDFDLTADDLAAIDQLQLTLMVDDGAVFYLNGVEVYRVNMPDGTPDASTLAGPEGVANATLQTVDVSKNSLAEGANRLSVEVHQITDTSSDIVFGAQLFHERLIDPGEPGLPGTPYVENAEEWIELYNRSATEAVELGGWKLDGGIEFEFAPGTVMPPDAYLIVAKDAAALAAKYPDVAGVIVGDYSARLSNRGEAIVLEDAVGNPADEVHYYDDGRWDTRADGDGSSLELRNPNADNSRAEAWAGSIESDASQWQSYTYTGVAAVDGIGPDIWDEFHFGLLTAGEVLFDNISVVEDPGGANVELIQNGGFQADTVDETPNAWRLIGTHGGHGQSVVVVDPDDPTETNKVLHLVATGPTLDRHDHAETTLAGGAQITSGTTYRISFDAKWLSGSNQVNTRLYYNWLQRTTHIDVPTDNGTPGRQNSQFVENVGPTYDQFAHQPVVPDSLEDVTVSVVANDPDTVATMTLWYSVAGGAWQSEPMAAEADGVHRGTIPGQAAGADVQFYVEGIDALGGVSTYPADGRDSRAMFEVQDNRANASQAHNVRVIMTPADVTWMYDRTNRHSNHRMGATVIVDEQTVYYDVGVRLKGSGVGRNSDANAGLSVEFHPDRLFRGVHQTISIERGQRKFELLVKHMYNHAAGGLASLYDDVAYIVTPRTGDTSLGLLAMARYGDVYLDARFENGSDGTVYNQELAYAPTSTVDGDPESLKLIHPLTHDGTQNDFDVYGDDKEAYRWGWQIRSNRGRDDYQPMMQLAQALALTGDDLDAASREIMDVDQWMRDFAMLGLNGRVDVYTQRHHHNFRVYQRPEDGLMLAFPWDMDRAFELGTDAALWASGFNVSNLIELPANTRLFYGHVLDIINTTFNTDYMTRWMSHFGSLTGQNYSTQLQYIQNRSANALTQLPAEIPFEITTNGGADFDVAASSVELEGNGWINVREIERFVDATTDTWETLDVEWTGQETWQLALPLVFGLNEITLRTVDFQGQPIATETISVESTLPDRPLQQFLRISEIMYHPADPTVDEQLAGFTDDDDFEFLELINTSDSTTLDSTTLDLTGVTFTDGIDFAFTAGTMLPPGERILVVRDAAAFAARYDTVGLNIAGEYRAADDSNKLSNGGETLKLEDADNSTIQEFAYNDSVNQGWPTSPDGQGHSLEAVSFDDGYGDPLAWNDYGQSAMWYASVQDGGSPGAAATAAVLERYVFYDGSAFDAGSDDDAIAPDKLALLPGQTATKANYTNYGHGINGVAIDIAWPAEALLLTDADFTLLVGNDNDPSSWTAAAMPVVTAVEGAGRGGSDRVYLSWTSGAPTNTWLQVTTRSGSANTGVLADDVFYFGNAIGETGNAPTNALVTAADLIAIRNHPRGAGNRADITTPQDINRDAQVDALDALLARNNATGPFDGLRLITTPLPVPVPPEAEGEQSPSVEWLDKAVLLRASRLPIASGPREAEHNGEALRSSWQPPSILLREHTAEPACRTPLSPSHAETYARALGRQLIENLPERPFTELDNALADLLSVDWL